MGRVIYKYCEIKKIKIAGINGILDAEDNFRHLKKRTKKTARFLLAKKKKILLLTTGC